MLDSSQSHRQIWGWWRVRSHWCTLDPTTWCSSIYTCMCGSADAPRPGTGVSGRLSQRFFLTGEGNKNVSRVRRQKHTTQTQQCSYHSEGLSSGIIVIMSVIVLHQDSNRNENKHDQSLLLKAPAHLSRILTAVRRLRGNPYHALGLHR